MFLDHIGQAGYVLVRLLQQVGETAVLLLVNQFAIALLILSLEQEEKLNTRQIV